MKKTRYTIKMAYNKYINSFADSNEYNAYIESDNAYSPNIGFIEQTKQVKWIEKVMKECIFYGTTEATTDFMIGSSVSDGDSDCIKVHVVQQSDGSDNIMYATKEDIFKTPVIIPIDTEITSIKKWKIDTSNVTDMNYMFGECYSLTSLDLSSFNTSNVTDMYNMFDGCSALTSLTLSSSFFNSSAVTEFDFSGITSWTETTSLEQFVNAISSKDGTGKTVKLSNITNTALTTEQKNSITSKGWTIA